MTTPLIPPGPGGDQDLRQLTGALDRPITPSPSFANALRARIEKESASQGDPGLPEPPISHRTARARSMPSRSGRRWLDIAIAAVLIVALLSGTIWYADIRIGGNDVFTPEATRFAAQPLLSTPATAGDVRETYATSDPGNTNAYPAGFDPEAEHEAQLLEDAPRQFGWAAVSGDTLVTSGNIELSAPGERLSAIDLTSGELLWTSSVIPMKQFVVSDDMIFGMFRESVSFDYAMSAVSLETGELIWAGEPVTDNGGLDIVSPLQVLSILRPVVIGDMLYYTDPNGTVIAHDATNGEILWTHSLKDSKAETGMIGGGSLVGDDDALYAVDPQNTIRKIDRHSGDVIDRFPMTDRPASAFVMESRLQGDSLIAISRSIGLESTTSFVDAVSTDDGEVLWSQRLGTAGLFVTVTEDVVAIPQQVMEADTVNVSDDITEPGLYVTFFDLDTGDPVSLYGPSSAPGTTVSASGSIVCINEGTAINCVDTASDNRTLATLPYAPGEESIAPLLFWNESAITLDVDDGVTLLGPMTQPQRAEETGDGEARGGSFASTSDRSLVNLRLDGPTEPLSLAWSHVLSDPLWVMPYGDVVASLGSSEIAVQDAATGEVLWSKPTDEAFRNTTYDTERSPKSLLAIRQGQPVALPWFEGDTMYYAGTTDLIGVNLYTGGEVFRTVHTPVDDSADLRWFRFPWDMALKDGTAYILTMAPHGYHVVTAIDLTSGDALWSFDAGEWIADDDDNYIWITQPIVTDNLVILHVWERTASSILALNIEDGSVAWEQDETLVSGRSDNSYSNISAVGDDYLVMTRRGIPTNMVDGTPNADESLQVSLYNLEDGSLLWTDTEGTFPDPESGLCLVVPGWDETSLYVPCVTDDTLTMFRYPFDGNGEAERLGTWQTPGPAAANIYDDEAAYFNTGTSIFRVQLESGETSMISLQGGESCAGMQADNGVVTCLHDDDLGTYTLQAYTPTPVATPHASPATSIVEQDAEDAGFLSPNRLLPYVS